MIAVECRAWAGNIRHDRMERRGLAHFTINLKDVFNDGGGSLRFSEGGATIPEIGFHDCPASHTTEPLYGGRQRHLEKRRWERS